MVGPFLLPPWGSPGKLQGCVGTGSWGLWGSGWGSGPGSRRGGAAFAAS